jgi:hypothetical protein
MGAASSTHIDAANFRQCNENDDPCQWCLKFLNPFKPASGSSVFERTNTRRIDVQSLAKASCRICRLFSVMIVRDHAQCEEFKFTWRSHPESKNPIKGTISVLPRYHDFKWSIEPLCLDVLYSPLENTHTVLQEWRPSRVSPERIKHWLQNCDSLRTSHSSQHGQCKAETQTVLRALRVLDCHSRLVITAPRNCAFVALSYVWGQPSEACETKAGLPEQLPQTLEDCIKFTLLLGYQYIWIDKYVSCTFSHNRSVTDGLVHRSSRLGRQTSPDPANGFYLCLCGPYYRRCFWERTI